MAYDPVGPFDIRVLNYSDPENTILRHLYIDNLDMVHRLMDDFKNDEKVAFNVTVFDLNDIGFRSVVSKKLIADHIAESENA